MWSCKIQAKASFGATCIKYRKERKKNCEVISEQVKEKVEENSVMGRIVFRRDFLTKCSKYYVSTSFTGSTGNGSDSDLVGCIRL